MKLGFYSLPTKDSIRFQLQLLDMHNKKSFDRAAIHNDPFPSIPYRRRLLWHSTLLRRIKHFSVIFIRVSGFRLPLHRL